MWITDFEYAGRRLSDFDSMIVSFDGDNGFTTKSAPQRKFNGVRNNGSHVSTLTSTEYDEDYTFTIQIGKNVCAGIDQRFTINESRELVRWLERKEFHKLKLIESSGEYHDIVYYGSFNANYVMDGDEVIGFSCEFTSNAPFAFGEEESVTTVIKEPSTDSFRIMDSSDDYGHHYTDAVITIMESGDFELSNSLDDSVVVIKNCLEGEVITIDGEHKIISSSMEHKKLYNDFNYNYPRLFRTEKTGTNVFRASIKCKLKLIFSPVRKVEVL